MAEVTFSLTDFEGLFVILPNIFSDNRGYFMESYNEAEFSKFIDAKFVQDNESSSKRGVLRGLHFQKKYPQGKLVRVIQGSIYDVAVDLRRHSNTFGRSYGIELTSENKKQLYIPEGFAHGFYVKSDLAIFAYKCTEYYHPEDEGGILWNDADIGIKWPIDESTDISLSNKDKNNPLLCELGFSYC